MTLDVNGTKLTALLDSGAETSVIQQISLPPDTQVDSSKRCKFSGISAGHIWSLGSAKLNLNLDNSVTVEQNFQIIESLPIDVDAIIGDDFLKKFNCLIDYGNRTLSIRLLNREISIPFSASNKIFLPSRCRVYRQISVLNADQNLILNSEVAPGVFVSNTAVSPESSVVSFMNTNDHDVTLDDPIFRTSSTADYHIFAIKTEKDGQNKNDEKVPRDRLNRLLELVKNNTPVRYQNKIADLCSEYSDVFSLPDEEVTTTDIYEQKLRFSDDTPVYTPNYRIPHAHRPIVEDEIQKLIRDGIVEPTISPYNSPLLLVPKASNTKDPKWRLVVDFRKLNQKLVPDVHPLPRIDEVLDQLGRAKFFSVADLKSSFHQIKLDPGSRDATAFSTHKGQWRFTRVPYGLNVSANAFCRMMAIAFSGLPPEIAFLYVDDIIIIGCSVEHHLKNIRAVFEICRKCNLKLNPEKCHWFQTQVVYLGHLCTDQGVKPDPSKMDKVENFPVPKNANEARRFVALANYYRRFIEKFAHKASPLNRLQKKNVKFEWTEECDKAFQELKAALVSPPLLVYPDFEKEFLLTTDASDRACGAVLSQEHDGLDRPIAYFSRSFSKGELNKSTIEKELLAIYFAIKHFEPYLYGRKFCVKTDHRPLVHLFGMTKPTNRLTRIRLDLEEFDFDILYVKGKDNVVADALSRIPVNELSLLVTTRAQAKRAQNERTKEAEKKQKENDIEKIERPAVYEALNNDACKTIMKFDLAGAKRELTVCRKRQPLLSLSLYEYIGKDGKLNLLALLKSVESELIGVTDTVAIYKDDEIFSHFYYGTFIAAVESAFKELQLIVLKPVKEVIAPEERQQLIRQFHDDPILGGHCGCNRLLAKLRANYKWRGISKDVQNYVKSCELCQRNKHQKHTHPESMIVPTPILPLDSVVMDISGPYVRSLDDNVYALTVLCELTRFLFIIPIPNKEAETVARALLDIILTHGPMKRLKSDNGTEFVNKTMQALADLMSIGHVRSTPYHPESVATVERNHGVLNQYLRMYVDATGSNWDTYARFFALSWNTSPLTHASDYTPFELMYNRKCPLPGDIIQDSDPLYNPDDFVKLTRFRFQKSLEIVRRHIEANKQKEKEKLDRRLRDIDLVEGDLVLVRNETGTKIQGLFKGPYKVIEIQYPNLNLIDDRNKQFKVHLDRVRKFTPRVN